MAIMSEAEKRAAQQQRSEGSTASERGRAGRSVADLNRRATGRMNRAGTSDALARFKNVFKEIIDKEGIRDFDVIAIDKAVTKLKASIIAVTMTTDTEVAFFSFIVGSSASTLQPRIVKENAQEYELPFTPGDMYHYENGRVLVERVIQSLKSTMGSDKQYLDGGAAVLPSELDADDVVRVRNTLYYAVNALDSLLGNIEPISIGDYAGNYFGVRVEMGAGTAESATGLPIRRTFAIDMHAAEQNSGSGSLVEETGMPLSKVTGYVDLQYTGPIPIPQQFGAPLMSTQIFAPRIIITGTQPLLQAVTPELQLLSLATSTLLLNRNAYLNALAPRYSGSADIHSLNGLKHDLDAEVGADSPDFNVFEFAQHYVHNQPSFVLHIADCDELSWILQMFSDAAAGVVEASDQIVAASNALTGDLFGRKFGKGPIAYLEDDRVIMGYFTDTQGRKVDLREIDYLAVLNLLGDDPEGRSKAFAFGDTFDPNKGGLAARLSQRIAILSDVLQGQLTITGYARPVVLDPDFLISLWEAITDTGIQITQENILDAYRNETRGYVGALNHGVDPTRVQFMQRRSAGGAAYAPQYRARHYHR